MNSDIQAQLQSRIEAFAADVTAILQRAVADAVADALGGARSPQGTRTALGKNAGARKTGSGLTGRGQAQHGAGKAARAVTSDALLREIAKKGERRMEELARALRTSTQVLKPAMKELVAAKKVRSAGKARGTKYRAA